VIALDARVLIAHLDERDALHERAVERLLETADHPLVCSPITLAEVLVGPVRHGRLDAARHAVAELGVQEIALSGDSAVRLASLRAATDLKLADCCVLLAAQDGRAEGVLTFGDRLTRAATDLGFVAQ
jgi:predicted nucleic acid-binding protein